VCVRIERYSCVGSVKEVMGRGGGENRFWYLLWGGGNENQRMIKRCEKRYIARKSQSQIQVSLIGKYKERGRLKSTGNVN